MRFIDLPYPTSPATDDGVNRYGDADFRRTGYVRRSAKAGVDDFDAVWDMLFELDPEITPGEYLGAATCCAQNAG